MSQPQQFQDSRMQKKSKQKDKKQKSSLMKKLLVKNKIVSILSHQPKKLMQLARKGNLVYKNLQQHTLLPKLTLKNLFPEIQDLSKKNEKHHEQFQEVNKQLTYSMLNFQHKFSQISQQDEGKILNIQTQKCYNHIPNFFFSQLSQNQIQRILTKNRTQAAQKAFDYIDFSDQVQYNINQQVGYKMKVFMDFACFLQAIAGLVDLSCKKIEGYRARNNIIRQIIVQKSVNINSLRTKQTNLTKCIQIVKQLKKVKSMQKSIMSLIHAKGKIGVKDFYDQYCKQHQKIKQFCCKKNLCNFGDIRYYVQRNYQQAFNRSLQNYLGEMTKIDKLKISQILKPTKAIYVSVQFQNKNPQNQRYGDKANFCLDESIEIQDQFQLTIKTNIEKQISNIFQYGLQKCTYSTDNLCVYLKQQLYEFELNLYASILEGTQRPKQDLIDNFVNYALNRRTQQELQTNVNNKSLSFLQKSEILNKISMPKYLQITTLISKKCMDLTVRCFSIVNQLMKILKPFQKTLIQKQEIISAYLIQLTIICFNFSNSCIGTFIKLRQIKQNELQMVDNLISQCHSWQVFVDEAQTKYEYVWRKLVFHLSDLPSGPKLRKDQSFQDLQQFVELNYTTKGVKGLHECENQDISEELIDKHEIKLKLINQIIRAKNQKINFNFYALSKLIINKELLKRIQNQTWLTISMNNNIQNSVGIILYGQRYLHHQRSQNDSKSFLSKSLLLDKSNFGIKRKSEDTIPPPPDLQLLIQTSENKIKVGDRSFKLIGVSQYMLQAIYLFFIYFDKYSFDSEKFDENKKQKQNIPQKSFEPQKMRLSLLIGKAIEIINILTSKIKYYLNNLKELQKKVKSFAKFLLLVFTQLDFFRMIILTVIQDKNQQSKKRRFQQNAFSKYTQKQLLQLKKSFLKQIDECMSQIAKKYNSIGYEKIKDSIKKMEINPKKQIKIPSDSTSQILSYFSKSLQIIEDIVIDQKQFWKFLNCPWIKIYLQKINQLYLQVKKYTFKSNGSNTNSGRRIQQIEWQDKMDWKSKQIRWLLSAIQNEKYGQHIKDISILGEQLKKIKDVRNDRR